MLFNKRVNSGTSFLRVHNKYGQIEFKNHTYIPGFSITDLLHKIQDVNIA